MLCIGFNGCGTQIISFHWQQNNGLVLPAICCKSQLKILDLWFVNDATCYPVMFVYQWSCIVAEWFIVIDTINLW